LRDRGGDLLAGRQRFRFMFAVAVGAYSIGITGLELLFFDTGMPALPSALNAAAIALLAGGFFAALFSLSPDGALVPLPEAQPVAVSVTRDEAADHAVILQALDAAMAKDRLYRDDTLTIGGLAARLGVPEYRLRKAINQQLGFRNFNAYVNALRLSEVKSALVDPAQREVPITTIALDAGFASIGPFNRAFKAATGTVPSEFRRRSLAES
jgi:AraC-like DNA-binding protein